MADPMMRSRQRGKPCRVEGHGSRCEVSHDRALRERAQERREALRQMARDAEEDGLYDEGTGFVDTR